MKSIKVIITHCFCWGLIIGYTLAGYVLKQFSFSDTAFGMSLVLIQIVQFYICFLWVYPNYVKNGKIIWLIAGIPFALISYIVLRYLIEEVLFNYWFDFHNYSSDTTFIHYIIDNIYFGSSTIVIAAGIWGVQRNFQAERDNRQLKAEVIKAELAFLKSQINPHFLYNTLNYVYSLAIPVSDQLATAILRLSDLMRYTLTESPDGMVKLIKEVEYLQSYVELSKMRFNPNCFVELDTSDIDESEKVAALMLIPFVENAFKHGVINDAQYPIRIQLQARNKELNFEVINKISYGQKDHSSGIGLVNVQRRLDLLYTGRYELIVNNDSTLYKVSLKIQL